MTTTLHTNRRPVTELLSVEADAVLIYEFPGTLSPAAIGPLDWTDHPATEGPYGQISTSAIAYLGSADHVHGWWLHYTQQNRDLDGIRHVLTLVAPCACGEYIAVHVPDEAALLAMLDELDTNPGAPVACDYRLRIRANSSAVATHDSYEDPF